MHSPLPILCQIHRPYPSYYSFPCISVIATSPSRLPTCRAYHTSTITRLCNYFLLQLPKQPYTFLPSSFSSSAIYALKREQNSSDHVSFFLVLRLAIHVWRTAIQNFFRLRLELQSTIISTLTHPRTCARDDD
jgi:hypothetical protein